MPLLWLLALLTMLVGSLCALPQENLKRLLAYSSVVHMGYLLIALLPGSADGFAAAVFYLAVYAAASLGAFAVIASLSSVHGEPQELAAWRGLGYRYPGRGAVLTICLLSLAGMPLTGGFIGKFALFHAAIQGGFTGLALVGILASLISFAYYLGWSCTCTAATNRHRPCIPARRAGTRGPAGLRHRRPAARHLPGAPARSRRHAGSVTLPTFAAVAGH